LIHNNRPGKDAELLKQFNEPSWNNPVVRYLDAAGKDIIDRQDRIWSTSATVTRMVSALKASKQEVPLYLTTVAVADSEPKQATATFAMHCYWEGEAKLGGIRGVSSTRSGWKDSLEVVTLKYDPRVVGYEKLLETAKSFECASKVYAHTAEQLLLAKKKVGIQAVAVKHEKSITDAKPSDQKYYLIQTPLKYLPLTETQATKINASLKSKRNDYQKWLSPRQLALFKRVKALVKQNSEALADWHYPPESQLVEYASRLEKRLSELE
jgi:hypothetical protein